MSFCFVLGLKNVNCQMENFKFEKCPVSNREFGEFVNCPFFQDFFIVSIPPCSCFIFFLLSLYKGRDQLIHVNLVKEM